MTSNYVTPYSRMGLKFSQRNKPAVDYDYDLPANIIESYLEEHEPEDSQLTKCYKEFKENKIDIKNVTLSTILNSFRDNNKFVDNKELYEQIAQFLDYAVSNNLLHRTKRESYENALNKALFQENEKYADSNTDTYAEPDFARYEANNFRTATDNEIINSIYDREGAIYLINGLKIYIRLSKECEGNFYTFRQAEKYLSLMLGLPIKITEEIEDATNNPNTEMIDKGHTISIYELILVHGEKFRPNIPKKYFEEGGITYRNVFIPTKYMKLQGEHTRLPKSILDLIYHVVGYKEKKFYFFLNWLAFFFKYLKKSQIAIALIGSQGAGKGILFAIITELFGKNYCVTINDESISSKFKAKMIRGILFYNFDEVTLNTSKKNDSFIKVIITNPSISLEEKNITMEGEIELYGQCLFSSNHIKALNLPKDDKIHDIYYR